MQLRASRRRGDGGRQRPDQQCLKESGFDGPGIKIGGNFQCQNNSGACDATIGMVGGNVQIHNNTGAGANVSLNEIHGNLQCQNDTLHGEIVGRKRSATSGSSSTTRMLALRADTPKCKLALMMLPLPLSSGEYGAIERQTQ